MLISDKLKNNNDFSDSEKKIAQFVLENLGKVSKLTIYELAQQTFTSVSTVSRFCKKVGSQSFKDFQLSLSREINSFSRFTGRVAYDFPIENNLKTNDIISTVQQLHIQVLNDTINNLDVHEIEKIVEVLFNANSIEIFAEANSFSIASNLYNKLIWLGLKSNLDNIPGNQFLKAKSLKKDDIVIMISYYGQSNTLNRIANHLIENNMKYILITGPKESALQKKAFYQLSVTPVEDKYKKVGSIGSDVALHTIIDILIMLLYTKKTENQDTSSSD